MERMTNWLCKVQMMRPMDKSYTVYQHIFPNGKSYIGITCQSLDKRFENGKGYKQCPKMAKAIEKYGWANIIHKTIAKGLTKQEAENLEIAMIIRYDTIRNGYNIEHGGNTTGTHNIETRKKISVGNKGKSRPKWSEQRKREYADKWSGNNNPFYGQHHTDETKQAQSIFMKGNQYNKSHHHTEEFKAMKSEQMHEMYQNGGHPRCKRVVETDPDGSEKVYLSLREVARVHSVSVATVHKHIYKGTQYKGYAWRYAG